MVASRTPPTGDLARNPGMCPDWESHQGPFGSQAGAQSPEPHQPGLLVHLQMLARQLPQTGDIGCNPMTNVLIKRGNLALAGVAQWIECQPVNQRFTGSIPSQGTCLGFGPGPQ